MFKKLQSLDEHERIKRYSYWEYPKENGIECPKCGEELFDTDATIWLSFFPAKRKIHCENSECDFYGHRTAH